MINKRLLLVDFNMSKKVPPLSVSPFIKAARWSFLIGGILYGTAKLRTYKILESKIRPLREKALIEKTAMLLEQSHQNTINELRMLARELDAPEIPPEMEKELSRSGIMDRTLPPANVSPLIKGARWSLLIAGILYGSSRYSLLSKKERKRLDELERTRPEREAKMKANKEKISKEQIDDLNKQLGISA